MGFDVCPFCEYESKALKARSVVNRHIKETAKKSKKERGDHPGVNDDAFIQISKQRKFHSIAKSEEERRTNNANRNAKYRNKRRLRDEKKVEAAFRQLR
jgi:hypothetical protein